MDVNVGRHAWIQTLKKTHAFVIQGSALADKAVQQVIEFTNNSSRTALKKATDMTTN